MPKKSLFTVLAVALIAGLAPLPAVARGDGRRLAPSGRGLGTRPAPEARSSAEGIIPGEIVVTYDGAPGGIVRSAARARVPGGVATRVGPRFDVVAVTPGSEAEAIRALSADRNVLSAEPNRRFSASFFPSDPNFGVQWGLNNHDPDHAAILGFVADADIDAPEGWATLAGDSSVPIAIVDTGVDMDHPDLVGQIYTNPGEVLDGTDTDGNGFIDDINGWDWIGDDQIPMGELGDTDDADNDPDDEESHGTHVAGIAGATGSNGIGGAGVNNDASIVPLRVLNDMGIGSLAAIAAAFDYAGDNDIPIVNASLGATDGPEPEAMKAAIMAHPDTLYIVAAGNGGDDGIGDDVDGIPEWPCSHFLPNIICVAASTPLDGRASFSNYSLNQVHLAAPGGGTGYIGTDIFSTIPGTPSASSGTYALSDSPDGFYLPDTDSWAERDAAIDLTGATGCSLDYMVMIDTEFDGFDVWDGLSPELMDDSNPWTLVDARLGGFSFGHEAISGVVPPVFEGSSTVKVRFRLDSDEVVQFDGVSIDDVSMTCSTGGLIFSDGFESGDLSGWTTGGTNNLWGVTTTARQYDYFPGTSMATPHVAGAASLLFGNPASVGVDPVEWANHVRNTLRASVDPAKPWMEAKTVWGGRLNLDAALDLIGTDLDPPIPPEMAHTHVGKTWQRSTTFDIKSKMTTDVGPAGVRHYDVQERSANYKGPFGLYGPFMTEGRTNIGYGGLPGRTYCFQPRATDNLFNVSDWGDEECTALPVNDRTLNAQSAWKKITHADQYRGTAMRATKKNVVLSVANVRPWRLAVVVTRCGNCGKIKVFFDGVLLKTLNLSGSLKRNKIFNVHNFGSEQPPGTVKIKTATGGKPVIIEGLGVSRN